MRNKININYRMVTIDLLGVRRSHFRKTACPIYHFAVETDEVLDINFPSDSGVTGSTRSRADSKYLQKNACHNFFGVQLGSPGSVLNLIFQ